MTNELIVAAWFTIMLFGIAAGAIRQRIETDPDTHRVYRAMVAAAHKSGQSYTRARMNARKAVRVMSPNQITQWNEAMDSGSRISRYDYWFELE